MSAYLDSELRTQLRVRLEQHTADCPQCHVVLGELRRMLALLRAVPEPVRVIGGPTIATAVSRRLHEPAAD
jgi:anti-sigma factor RsiW